MARLTVKISKELLNNFLCDSFIQGGLVLTHGIPNNAILLGASVVHLASSLEPSSYLELIYEAPDETEDREITPISHVFQHPHKAEKFWSDYLDPLLAKKLCLTD